MGQQLPHQLLQQARRRQGQGRQATPPWPSSAAVVGLHLAAGLSEAAAGALAGFWGAPDSAAAEAQLMEQPFAHISRVTPTTPIEWLAHEASAPCTRRKLQAQIIECSCTLSTSESNAGCGEEGVVGVWLGSRCVTRAVR